MIAPEIYSNPIGWFALMMCLGFAGGIITAFVATNFKSASY